jgi:hypothetical protein
VKWEIWVIPKMHPMHLLVFHLLFRRSKYVKIFCQLGFVRNIVVGYVKAIGYKKGCQEDFSL